MSCMALPEIGITKLVVLNFTLTILQIKYYLFIFLNNLFIYFMYECAICMYIFSSEEGIRSH